MFDDSIRKARGFAKHVPSFFARDEAMIAWVKSQEWYKVSEVWPWQFRKTRKSVSNMLYLTPSLATWLDRTALENPLSHIEYNNGRPSTCLSFVVLCSKLGISPYTVQDRLYKRRAVEAADAMFLRKEYEVSPATVGMWLDSVTGVSTSGKK